VRRLAVWIATGFGIGRLPYAPATWASLAVALVLLPLASSLDPWIVGGVALLVAGLGVWSAGEAEKSLGTDAKPIVIDEVAGMLVGICGVPMGKSPLLTLTLLFVLFRFFDIAKPPPIRQLDKAFKNGFGVMVDDLAAAGYTLLALALWRALFG